MGFTAESRLIESTSFKTKFLDYIQYSRPVLIWGPEYCTAVRTANEHESALVVTDPRPAAVVDAMKMLASDQLLRARLVTNANKMKDRLFSSEIIFGELKQAIDSTIEGFYTKATKF
jgi:hypothetical protein